MRVTVVAPIEGRAYAYATGRHPDTVSDGRISALQAEPEGLLLAAAWTGPEGLEPGEAHVLVDYGPAARWRTYYGPMWVPSAKVAAWTRWRHHAGAAEVWVFLPELAAPEEYPPVIAPDTPWAGSPVPVCRSLLALAVALGHPWVLTAGHTAHLVWRDILKPDASMRGLRPDRRREPWWASGSTAEPPAQAGGDLIWDRRPLKAERELGWVHGYDMNAARLAALGVVEVAANKLHPSDGPIGYDPRLAGYWTIDPASLGVENMRLGAGGPLSVPVIDPDAIRSGSVTVTNPIMDWWVSHGCLPTVVDARVAPGRRLFRSVVEGWDKARLSDDPWLVTATKAAYRAGAGLLASPGGLIYRPDWYHGTMDRQRITLLRMIEKVWKLTGRMPLRIHTDCLWYASELSAENFAADAGIVIGRGLGQWKIHSSQPYDEVYRRKPS